MVNTVPVIYDGITMTMLNYVENMDKSDLQVDFVAINQIEPHLRSQIEEMGCKVHELPNRNTHKLKYLVKLAALIRKNKYDVVHVHCNSCTAAIEMLSSFLGGAKMRCSHSHNTKCSHLKMHKLLRPLFNLFYTDAFACGTEAGNWLFPGKSFTVLKNATNTDKYKYNPAFREEYRSRYNLEGKIAIGHVAHFTHHKNHGFLIDAFAGVMKEKPDYVLFLVGDGKYRNEIEEKVRDLQLQDFVVFTGTTLEIPQILSAMDMMVLPSLYEGLPNVIIEWQIAGLPMLISDTTTLECKLTELVNFLPLNKKDWVNAILNIRILDDRAKSSNESIEAIKNAGFSIKENSKLLKDYYLKRLNKI